MKHDSQYGPLIMLSAGGKLIEFLDDRAIALAPVTRRQAEEMIGRLRVRKLLLGQRGDAAANIDALVDLTVEFSKLAARFARFIAELDINPVIVDSSGCTIVDSLLIPNTGEP